MDNYEVAINGTTLAARILGIETPDVQFFYNQDLMQKSTKKIYCLAHANTVESP